MAVKSLFDGGATSKLYLDRRQFYITPDTFAELYPSDAPFSTFLMNVEQKTNLQDPLFKMFEHRAKWMDQQFQVTSTVLVPNSDSESDAITIKDNTTQNLAGESANVADNSYVGLVCEVWDSTLTTKKGVILVTTVASATTFKCKSLKAATVQLANDDYFCVISNARGEGQTAREAWSDELDVVYNSTQIFDVPVEITGTLYHAALRGANNELARLRNDKSKEFKMQKEAAYLFGTSVMGTGMSGTAMSDTYRTDADGKPVRTTYGIIPMLETYGSTSGAQQNVFTINQATYKYDNFVDDTEKIFQYSNDGAQKFAFCAPGAMSYWSKLSNTSNSFSGKSGWKVTLSDSRLNSLGFNVRLLETPHGILHLVPTKAMRGRYNNYMVIVDHNNLFHATYRPDEFKNDVKKDDDYDGVKDVYKGDSGIGVTLQEAHQLIKIV